MRPVPIPDEAVWENGRRMVIAPPGGDLTHPEISPAEAVVEPVSVGGRVMPSYSFMCALEGDDLEKLQAGGHVWVTFYGAVMPFSVTAVRQAGDAIQGGT